MSTLLYELLSKSDEITKEICSDLSGIPLYVNVPNPKIAFGWQDPEDFVKDMKSYEMNRTAKDMVTDLSGAKIRWAQLEKDLQKEKDKVFRNTIKPVGSNANWGRITQPEELQGAFLEEVGINNIKTPQVITPNTLINLRDTFTSRYGQNTFQRKDYQEKIYEEGELTAPIMKSIEEQEDADTVTESSWFCKGCSKCFATKASLKRHHDRKKSCKEICEKKEDLSGTPIEVPDKPYIVDWIEQIQTKAISGDQNEKPYCKHCEIEFANKSNLNKHLAKSVACDKLAKQEFLKLLST